MFHKIPSSSICFLLPAVAGSFAVRKAQERLPPTSPETSGTLRLNRSPQSSGRSGSVAATGSSARRSRSRPRFTSSMSPRKQLFPNSGGKYLALESPEDVHRRAAQSSGLRHRVNRKRVEHATNERRVDEHKHRSRAHRYDWRPHKPTEGNLVPIVEEDESAAVLRQRRKRPSSAPSRRAGSGSGSTSAEASSGSGGDADSRLGKSVQKPSRRRAHRSGMPPAAAPAPFVFKNEKSELKELQSKSSVSGCDTPVTSDFSNSNKPNLQRSASSGNSGSHHRRHVSASSVSDEQDEFSTPRASKAALGGGRASRSSSASLADRFVSRSDSNRRSSRGSSSNHRRHINAEEFPKPPNIVLRHPKSIEKLKPSSLNNGGQAIRKVVDGSKDAPGDSSAHQRRKDSEVCHEDVISRSNSSASSHSQSNASRTKNKGGTPISDFSSNDQPSSLEINRKRHKGAKMALNLETESPRASFAPRHKPGVGLKVVDDFGSISPRSSSSADERFLRNPESVSSSSASDRSLPLVNIPSSPTAAAARAFRARSSSGALSKSESSKPKRALFSRGQPLRLRRSPLLLKKLVKSGFAADAPVSPEQNSESVDGGLRES